MNLKIESIKELKFVASNKPQDFFILLKENLLARKRIFYDEVSNLFFVEDFVTSSETTYTIKQLKKGTNIVKAIKKGSFFLETNNTEAANLRTSMALLT